MINAQCATCQCARTRKLLIQEQKFHWFQMIETQVLLIEMHICRIRNSAHQPIKCLGFLAYFTMNSKKTLRLV